MKNYHVAIIGSGSTYTPEIIDGLISHWDSLPLSSLRLMDIDERKRTIVGGLCKRMLDHAGKQCEFILTDNLDEALQGADFVLTQIRVGKLPARVLDETIPLKYGLIGQETTGIGGFFKALRTIPVILDIARRMERLCPEAFLINFTNPSGIVTQALQEHSCIRSIGLCNVPINMVDDLREKLGAEKLEVQYLGLNHLSWITGAIADGVDQSARVLEEGMNTAAMRNIKASGFSPRCIATAGGIPSSYLEYYYNRDRKLADEKAAEKCRGEVCIEIEEGLLKDYANPALCTKPEGLDKRGGAKYSLAAVTLMDAIANDKQEVHIVNIRNNGALSFMEESDVVEIPCRVGKTGATPLPIPRFSNRHIIELMRTVKAYECHTVNAAITGDEQEAMRALLIHPLLGDFETSYACFQELKTAHRAYLPQFSYNAPQSGK